MSPRAISDLVVANPPTLAADEPLEQAIRKLLETDLPALPVVDEGGRFAGIFGEREFMQALFPGYVGQLRHAAYLSESIDAALERREACRYEPVGRYMNTEHIDVGPHWSDVQLAEIFMHHRVLVVPIIEEGRITGIITRHAFFTEVAGRFLEQSD